MDFSPVKPRQNSTYTRVRNTAATSLSNPPPDDLALMVSRSQFQTKAIHLLKLARSALIYLAIGVGFEERRREPSRAGVPIEELASTPFLSDADKT